MCVKHWSVDAIIVCNTSNLAFIRNCLDQFLHCVWCKEWKSSTAHLFRWLLSFDVVFNNVTLLCTRRYTLCPQLFSDVFFSVTLHFFFPVTSLWYMYIP